MQTQKQLGFLELPTENPNIIDLKVIILQKRRGLIKEQKQEVKLFYKCF